MQVSTSQQKKFSKAIFRKILVPFDNSKMSDRAFWHAINLNFKHKSEIIILSVFYSEQYSSSFLTYNTHQTVIEQKKLNEVKIKHKKLKEISEECGIPCRTFVATSSSITQTVMSYVYSTKADLVIMGTRGNGSDRKLMLGSVSLEISQNAPIPVLLVK
ncbi:MAG: universal stress protein [Nitrosopumilus sp.]|uniref:universal stress protein n=1 Tax=Nitrosopumilus sp. TaxID=2024843 RepID=UPI00242CBA05|nr:universal stress protein [Nitrosopumilus sp.]MCV0367722.1 universal stress protein [Nitrosopumilus sp.]